MDDGGLGRFQRRMRAIPTEVRRAVQPAMERAAEEVCDIARALCPVDDGKLRASIGWTWGAPPEGAMALGAVRDGAALSITIYAGNDEAFYARFVEFGTQGGTSGERVAGGAGNRQSKKGRISYRTHPGSPAQPFFYPAWRLGKKRAVARINRAISKAIREAR
jgi:HK97 gp10 family phage protein